LAARSETNRRKGERPVPRPSPRRRWRVPIDGSAGRRRRIRATTGIYRATIPSTGVRAARAPAPAFTRANRARRGPNRGQPDDDRSCANAAIGHTRRPACTCGNCTRPAPGSAATASCSPKSPSRPPASGSSYDADERGAWFCWYAWWSSPERVRSQPAQPRWAAPSALSHSVPRFRLPVAPKPAHKYLQRRTSPRRSTHVSWLTLPTAAQHTRG
jgi:hypothetical protein